MARMKLIGKISRREKTKTGKIFFYPGAIPLTALASADQDSAADDATSARQISGAIRTWSAIRASAT